MIRLDRILSLALFRHLDGEGSGNGIRMPILMYHSVSHGSEPYVHPYYGVVTAPDIFNAQMRLLKESGFRVITLDEAMARLCSGNFDSTTGNDRCAVITFDDGYLDFYSHAYPILEGYGFHATVFLPTSYIAHERKRFKGRDCMVWKEVQELNARGVTFGSHTVTHPHLETLGRDDIMTELLRSKETIEDKLGHAVHGFSYPFGFPDYDSEFRLMIKDSLMQCGYRYGVTTRIGTQTRREDRYLAKRIPVNSSDDTKLLAAKLNGGYDWMYPVQKLAKMKRWIKCQICQLS